MECIYDLIDGNGNPPYTLYQSEEGKWGLVDKDGKKLPAAYNRRGADGTFYLDENEAMDFDPIHGFYLVAWFDPDECGFMK